MSKDLCVLVSLVSVFIATIKCDFFSAPSSQILYEGDRATIVCHVEGNAFWQVNGTIYSELNAAFFESRGITSFDFFVGDSELNKTLTIVGSVLDNNNTVIRCISVQQNGITNSSDNATITVLGPPSNVTLRELNSMSVEVTWSESFFPPTVTLERYSITVFNTSEPNNHQQQIDIVSDVGPPTSDGRYSRLFSFGQSLAQCTQITFSVTSISSIGTSSASNISWERPLYIGRSGSEFKDSLSCSGSLSSKTLTVSFKPHKLCAFQSANYLLSLTENGQSIASTGGTFSGSQQQKTIQHSFTDQNMQTELTVQVSVTSPYGSEQASIKCYYLKGNPSTGGLSINSGSGSGGVSGGFVAGVIISSIVVILAIILIIGVAVYLLRKRFVHPKHIHKPL